MHKVKIATKLLQYSYLATYMLRKTHEQTSRPDQATAKALGLTQAEMMSRIGMSRQQYQRLESKGNPRLDNLELLAKGLKMELMLIPQEHLQAVKALLDGKVGSDQNALLQAPAAETIDSIDNPWNDLLTDDT